MLSLDSEFSVPGFKVTEIGYRTLVRARLANLQINVTNDGQMALYKLNVRTVIESYVGQDKPILFNQRDAQIIDQIAPKTMMPLTFKISTSFPGLVAVAVYVTDSNNNAVMAKRTNEKAYEQSPVRYWFYVVDDISVETLRAIKALVAQKRKDAEKPKTKRLKEAKK
ncbi:MAG: hypothetical protein HY528_02250 [Chloroflexi bacterium]|nr:hypothetical protein [Chloroflexota bacterium]